MISAALKGAIRRWRERNPEKVKQSHRGRVRVWKRLNTDKVKAHKSVGRALKSGKLVRPNACERCGKSCKPHAHHSDYAKPLEVRWLCFPCHMAEHGISVAAVAATPGGNG